MIPGFILATRLLTNQAGPGLGISFGPLLPGQDEQDELQSSFPLEITIPIKASIPVSSRIRTPDIAKAVGDLKASDLAACQFAHDSAASGSGRLMQDNYVKLMHP